MPTYKQPESRAQVLDRLAELEASCLICPSYSFPLFLADA
jgi:hypothetical protein